MYAILFCIIPGVFYHLEVIKMEFGEKIIAIPQGILKQEGADLPVLYVSVYVSVLFVSARRFRNINSF